jgi:ABC-type branched-subunit amino acid transport system substrate-binding protein
VPHTAVPERARGDVWRVALVIPLQGPAGLYGPSCEAIGELAADELNAAGGVLGREVTVEVIDGGAAPSAVAAEVNHLVRAGQLDAVTGWHISAVRNSLAPVLAGRVPYFYTPMYEGGERRSGIYCCGEVPRYQVRPALRWLRDNLASRHWCVVGDDYVWPRASSRAVRQYARELDLTIVDESFVQLGSGQVQRLVDRVAATRCNGVLMLLVGQDAVEFNRRFAALGLHERMLRFSPLMEENMLMASGAPSTKNLFSSAAYFRSLATPGALDLIGRYTAKHGLGAPPLNNMAESCYEGMHAMARLTGRAGTAELRELNAAIDGVAYHGPRGTVEFRGSQAALQVYLAMANGCDFDVITRL